MSTVVNRYLKLNTNWAGTKWVAKMSDGGKLAWLAIQCHAKAHGMNGIVTAEDAWTIQQQYFLSSEESVHEAIAQAKTHNALLCDGETWILLNWDKEQGDPTGAERQKRWRDSQKEPSAQPGEPDRNADNALRNASNAEERREENIELESSGEDSNSAQERDLSEPTGLKSRMKRGEFPAFWARFQALYPARSGGQNWKAARDRAVAKLKAGADPCSILEAAERYAEWCKAAGIFGTGRVPMAATWLSQDRWLEDYGDPSKAGVNTKPALAPLENPADVAARRTKATMEALRVA